MPIHALSAHPESADSPEFIVSSQNEYSENSILSRMTHLGFRRLRKNVFTERPDLLSTHYVSHADFIKKTDSARFHLLHQFRQVRLHLQSPFSFFFNRERFVDNLRALHTCWTTYRNSHELLKEMGAVFEEKDHRKPYFEAIHDIRYDHLFFTSSFRPDILNEYSLATLKLYDRCSSMLNLHDPLGWWVSKTNFTLSREPTLLQRHRKAMDKEDFLQHQGNASIDQTLQEKFSQSKSAQLIE